MERKKRIVQASLLDDINSEITSAGGRIKLAYIIMKESPNWFSPTDHVDINVKLSKQIWKDSKKTGRINDKFWSDADTDYLIKNWGYVPSKKISNFLGRSTASLRQKFLDTVGIEAYRERVESGIYKTSSNTLKKFRRCKTRQ